MRADPTADVNNLTLPAQVRKRDDPAPATTSRTCRRYRPRYAILRGAPRLNRRIQLCVRALAVGGAVSTPPVTIRTLRTFAMANCISARDR